VDRILFREVNDYPRQWTYAKNLPSWSYTYPGRRVLDFYESKHGTVWIGTEDKGLFHSYPESGKIEKFSHRSISQNVHGWCLDCDVSWVGIFSGGLCCIDLSMKHVSHYQKGISPTSLHANNVLSMSRSTSRDLWMSSTYGMVWHARDTDAFTRMPELGHMFVYIQYWRIMSGNLWLATYCYTVIFRLIVNQKEWKNFIFLKTDSISFPSDKAHHYLCQ